MHLCSRKKAMYSPPAEGQINVGPTAPAGPFYEEVSPKEEIEVRPTAPAGPFYEEVSPKEEIELNTNQAYGPRGI